jgi:hypothetical protein
VVGQGAVHGGVGQLVGRVPVAAAGEDVPALARLSDDTDGPVGLLADDALDGGPLDAK